MAVASAVTPSALVLSEASPLPQTPRLNSGTTDKRSMRQRLLRNAPPQGPTLILPPRFGCSSRAGDILLPVPATMPVNFTAHCPGFCRNKNGSGHVSS
ncbi:unnamed protein product [Urochloa humidicola]